MNMAQSQITPDPIVRGQNATLTMAGTVLTNGTIDYLYLNIDWNYSPLYNNTYTVG